MLTFLAGIVAITWLYWTLLIGLSVAIIVADEYDAGVFAFICWCAILVLAFHSLVLGNPFLWLATHPSTILLYIVGYFVAGTVWSFVKWYFFLLNVRDAWIKFQVEWKSSTLSDQLFRWKNRHGAKYGKQIPPRAKNNKARITRWMTYWPWSMVWTILNDPIRRAFHRIFQALQDQYERVSRHVFRNNLPVEQPPTNTPDSVEDDHLEIPYTLGTRRGL